MSPGLFWTTEHGQLLRRLLSRILLRAAGLHPLWIC